MPPVRRPGQPRLERPLVEVHPDYAELVRTAADRELAGVEIELVVTADLPPGTAARLTLPVVIAERELDRRRAEAGE